MELDVAEWIYRTRFIWLALLVAFFVAMYLVKRKTGLQGWRRMVPGNIMAGMAWIAGGAARLLGWVMKKIPWKPILVWGPWVVVLLILGFYGVENWRGARAWKQARAEWEGQGRSLNVADYLPPEIPDGENFAKHPEVVAQSQDQDGLTGPQYGHIPGFSDGHKDFWNGRPELGTAVDLRTWLPAADRLTGEEETALRCLELFGVVEKEMAGVAEAVRRPGCRFDQRGGSGRLAKRWTNEWVIMPLSWTKPFRCRSLFHIRAGHPEAALEDLETQLLLAEKMQADPLIIGLLIEMTIVHATETILWEGLRAQLWSHEQLARLEELLRKFDYPKRGIEVMKCEGAYLADSCAFMADNRDQVPLPTDFGAMLFGSSSTTWWEDVKNNAQKGMIYVIPGGWFDQLRAESLRGLDRCVLRPEGVEAAELSFGMTERIDREMVGMGDGILASLQTSSLVSFRNGVERIIIRQGRVDLMRVAVALERYRLQLGDYPTLLEALALRDLPELPSDRVTGESLRYRIKEDGTPIVYGVGLNERDDGGIPARRPEHLDWVWQYTGTPGQTENDWYFGRRPKPPRGGRP